MEEGKKFQRDLKKDGLHIWSVKVSYEKLGIEKLIWAAPCLGYSKK